jgi:hypothetical protein
MALEIQSQIRGSIRDLPSRFWANGGMISQTDFWPERDVSRPAELKF